MGSTTKESSKLDGCVAILVPKYVQWSGDNHYKDWFLPFRSDARPEGVDRSDIWIDAKKDEALYPGQLIVIRKTSRPVRGSITDITYWEIVK